MDGHLLRSGGSVLAALHSITLYARAAGVAPVAPQLEALALISY